MDTLRDLMNRHAQPGRLDWIGLRPARRADILSVEQAELSESGLIGDRHPSPGKRAVTLIQAEHLPVIAALIGQPTAPEMLRRNLLVSGINLSALKGRKITIGSATLEITGICAPCSRMEEIFGPGGYSAVRGHGGWTAKVLRPGRIQIGDTVTPIPDQPEGS